MNFLSIAADALASRAGEKMGSAASPFGRMAGAVQAGVEPQSAGATAQQEQMARQNGFNNYNEMVLWSRQRQQRGDRTADGRVVGRQGGGVLGQIEGAINDPSGTWDKLTQIHPRNLFNDIGQKWRDAVASGQQ